MVLVYDTVLPKSNEKVLQFEGLLSNITNFIVKINDLSKSLIRSKSRVPLVVYNPLNANEARADTYGGFLFSDLVPITNTPARPSFKNKTPRQPNMFLTGNIQANHTIFDSPATIKDFDEMSLSNTVMKTYLKLHKNGNSKISFSLKFSSDQFVARV